MTRQTVQPWLTGGAFKIVLASGNDTRYLYTTMNAIEKYGPEIQALNKFVTPLDPAVKGEAFRFLLARQFGESDAHDRHVNGLVAATAREHSQLQHGREFSPQELIRTVGASTTFEKAVLFGFWLEMHQGHKSFSGSKLKEVFEAARETPPANPSDVVAKLERSGRFMRADKIGGTQYYRLTRTAVEEIESKLKSSDEQ